MARLLIRLGLLVAFAFSIWVGYYAITELGIQSSESWLLVAADLAVLTSILSTWSGQRILELTEDANLPNVSVEFDPHSRYGVVQVRAKNTGGSPAFDVKVKFDNPINKQSGGQVTLGNKGNIAILSPDQSASELVGTSHWFFSQPELTFKGTLEFKAANKRRVTNKFVLSAEQFVAGPSHDSELPYALWNIQQIPAILKEINSKLNR